MTDDRGSDTQQVVTVTGVPARLFLESQDHQHDLIRELQLIELGDRFVLSTQTIPARLARLISDLLDRYDDVRAATRLQAVAALDAGQTDVDLEVPVAPGMAEALQEWLRLLEEADTICGQGDLLHLGAPDDMRELRRWYVGELVAKLSHD